MSLPAIYNTLADLTLIAHVALVIFVVFGQLVILIGWIRLIREDQAAVLCSGHAEPSKLLHQELIGQAVEPVAADAGCFVAARDRHDARDARHRPMERCVEARDLAQRRTPFGDRLHQFDFQREMLRVEGHVPPQVGDQSRRDQFWCAVLHAVDDPMPDRFNRFKLRQRHEPVEKPRGR